MPKRAFSLIELLIVVGVVVALGALVSVNLLDAAASAGFDEAARRIESAFVLARADAQRERRPLSVVAVEGAKGVSLVLETFEPGAEGASGGQPSAAGEERAARRLVVLPRGVRITHEAPAAAEGGVAGGAGGGVTEESRRAGDERVRLCVMLPDGGAWSAATAYLRARERAAKIGVNRWTAGAVIEPVADATGEPESSELPAEEGAEEGATP